MSATAKYPSRRTHAAHLAGDRTVSRDSGTIEAGRAAWQRIRDHGRKSWDDWLTVGRALIIGRTEAMQKARANRPIGSTYNRLIGSSTASMARATRNDTRS
jgi:hypothetical protein